MNAEEIEENAEMVVPRTTQHRRRQAEQSPPAPSEQQPVAINIINNANNNNDNDFEVIFRRHIPSQNITDEMADSGDDEERRRRQSAESGYGSPLSRRRSSMGLNPNPLFSSSPPLRFAFGWHAAAAIRFPHRTLAAADRATNAADSFRSIGTQTEDNAFFVSIGINHEEELDIDQDDDEDDECCVSLDDAFLAEGEEPAEVDGRRGLGLPDVVPEVRGRAHSVSLPVSLLDFTQPRDVGRCLSHIASDFDHSFRLRSRSSSHQQPEEAEATGNEVGGRLFNFMGRRARVRSQSASEAPSVWPQPVVSPSAPLSRSVATSAPPTPPQGTNGAPVGPTVRAPPQPSL